MRSIRTFKAIAATLLLAVILSGCSRQLVGNWKTDPEPKDVPYYITSATFKEDGTYAAVARQNSSVEPLSGTYEFDGMNLKLKTPGKQDRVYRATYLMMGPTLEIAADGKKITMKKQ